MTTSATRACRASPPRRAQGFSLLAILLLTAALSLLALGAANSTLLQERMAGAARDRHVALQAAEAALRDAEADLDTTTTASQTFTAGCTDGLCLAPSVAATGAQSAPRWQTLDWAASGRAYGSRTGAAALLGPGNAALAAQPSYVIEQLPELPPDYGSSACAGAGCSNPSSSGRAYRITVRASGVRASTVVMLQSIYVLP